MAEVAAKISRRTSSESLSLLSCHISLGKAFGLSEYTFRRVLLLVSCILGVFQYGLVLTNGVSVEDFNDEYELTTKQGDVLYSGLNFGACALSFIPGLCYDRFGSVVAMILGMIIFNAGVILQLVWTPTFPDWLSTMQGLMFCYVCFGCASTFFNVIGSFVPLTAFPSKDTGKVSACVQVCMSLGITFQTQAYRWLQDLGGDVVRNYLIYALVFTNVTGVLMCVVFRSARGILEQGTSLAEDDISESSSPSLKEILRMPELHFMAVLFFIAVGFSFSFLNCQPRIAAEADVSSSSVATIFGVLNALGRMLVCIPLDYTRHARFGGVFAYLAAALVVFASGVLLLALPWTSEASETLAVRCSNLLVAVGYGGLLGIIPPALKFTFGSQHLGLIYGILYVGVAISEPLWTMLFVKPSGCSGLRCYRTYYLSCVLSFFAVFVLAAGMLLRDSRRVRSRSRDVSVGGPSADMRDDFA